MALAPNCAKTLRAVTSASALRDSALWDRNMGLNALLKVSNGANNHLCI